MPPMMVVMHRNSSDEATADGASDQSSAAAERRRQYNKESGGAQGPEIIKPAVTAETGRLDVVESGADAVGEETVCLLGVTSLKPFAFFNHRITELDCLRRYFADCQGPRGDGFAGIFTLWL